MLLAPRLTLHPQAATDPELRRNGYPTEARRVEGKMLLTGDQPLLDFATHYSYFAFAMDGFDVFPVHGYILAHRSAKDLAAAIHRCLVQLNLYTYVHVNGVTLYDPKYGHHLLMRSATDEVPYQYGLLWMGSNSNVLSCLTIYIDTARFAALRHGSRNAVSDHIRDTLLRLGQGTPPAGALGLV